MMASLARPSTSSKNRDNPGVSPMRVQFLRWSSYMRRGVA